MDDLIAQDADLIDKLRNEDSYYRIQEKHWCIDAEELERQRLAAANRIAEQAAELAKWKALAETLAGALEAAAYALHTVSESNPDCMGWEPPYPSTVSTVSVEAKAATETLRQYKEATQ